MLVSWSKFSVIVSFSWCRKRRLCHKMNLICFLWTLILQHTYICVEGWAEAPSHSLSVPLFLLCISLPLQNVLKLNFIVHGSSQSQYVLQWRRFYRTRLSFLRPGFKSRWRIFSFRKKEYEINNFLNEISVFFFKNVD